MRKSYLKLASIVLLLLSYGCGNRVYLVTDTDPDFNPKVDETFHLFIPDLITIREKKIFRLFRSILEASGMKLVDSISDAELVISLYIDLKMYDSQKTIFLPYFTNTSGSVGGVDYNETTTGTRPVQYTSTTINRQVTIVVVKPVYSQGSKPKYSPVWNGFFEMQANEFDRNPGCYLTKLVEQYGTKDRRIHVSWPVALRCEFPGQKRE